MQKQISTLQILYKPNFFEVNGTNYKYKIEPGSTALLLTGV